MSACFLKIAICALHSGWPVPGRLAGACPGTFSRRVLIEWHQKRSWGPRWVVRKMYASRNFTVKRQTICGLHFCLKNTASLEKGSIQSECLEACPMNLSLDPRVLFDL